MSTFSELDGEGAPRQVIQPRFERHSEKLTVDWPRSILGTREFMQGKPCIGEQVQGTRSGEQDPKRLPAIFPG